MRADPVPSHQRIEQGEWRRVGNGLMASGVLAVVAGIALLSVGRWRQISWGIPTALLVLGGVMGCGGGCARRASNKIDLIGDWAEELARVDRHESSPARLSAVADQNGLPAEEDQRLRLLTAAAQHFPTSAAMYEKICGQQLGTLPLEKGCRQRLILAQRVIDRLEPSQRPAFAQMEMVQLRGLYKQLLPREIDLRMQLFHDIETDPEGLRRNVLDEMPSSIASALWVYLVRQHAKSNAQPAVQELQCWIQMMQEQRWVDLSESLRQAWIRMSLASLRHLWMAKPAGPTTDSQMIALLEPLPEHMVQAACNNMCQTPGKPESGTQQQWHRRLTHEYGRLVDWLTAAKQGVVSNFLGAAILTRLLAETGSGSPFPMAIAIAQTSGLLGKLEQVDLPQLRQYELGTLHRRLQAYNQANST